MTRQTPIGTCAKSMCAETERILHEFVRDTVSHLATSLKDSTPAREEDTRWERGSDGHFRERKKCVGIYWSMLTDDWLTTLPKYHSCVAQLKSDLVIGPHLDHMVGTSMSSSRIEARNIFLSLIYAMLDDEGCFVFTDERFDKNWQELLNLFDAGTIAFKMVAPLPNLVVPLFPLRLNGELVLDRFTDDEVTRCHQVGVIRPILLRFSLIYSEVAVGIRRIKLLPKLIWGEENQYRPLAAEGEGAFGDRPLSRDDLVIDDVLSVLRLFKQTRICSAGHACWTDAPFLESGTSYRVLRQWPYGGEFAFSESEIPTFLELWRLLEEGSAQFGFSIHRFNLAFDRGLLTDRIVDLVIAAEALFLRDLDDKYRGELRFRFALRAAKFIEHPSYDEHDIFRIMRDAYDVRSAIVHGGSPKETPLPDDQSATLSAFTDVIEELVRLGLRKALSMKVAGKEFRQSEYWDSLMFSNRALKEPRPN